MGKKSIILFLSLINFAPFIYGQNLRDIIITKENDTIYCKITLVNDNNIFYQYKKKKNIKTNYIAKELVLNFEADNLKSVTVKRKEFEIYNKCDSCKNWIIDSFGDTIFNNLKVNYVKKDSSLIESIRWNGSGSSQTFTSCDIKEAYWNGIKYFSISPDLRYETITPPIYKCADFLGYYTIKDKISLIKYASFQEVSATNHGKFKFGMVSSFESLETIAEYCVEIFSNRIKIPKINKHFRITMINILYKDQNLITRLENKEFKYKDIEEVIKIYNRNQK